MNKPAQARRVLVVLGMHRSGTSALTRVLNMLGAQVPEKLMDPDADNRKGYWESYPVSVLNDDILESGGSDWQDWDAFQPRWYETVEPEEFRRRAVALVNDEFANAHLLALKDPRMCRLFPFWKDVFKDAGLEPQVILPLRHPIEVAASLHKRDGLSDMHSLLLWLRNVLEAEHASRGVPRAIVSYDAFMSDPNALITILQDRLDLVWPRLSGKTREEIIAFVDSGMRNNHEANQGMVSPQVFFSDWLNSVYSTLLGWAANGENSADYATLDTIRERLNDIAEPLRGIVREMTRMNNTIDALQDTLEENQANYTASEMERSQLEQDKIALQGALGKTDALYKQSESTSSKLAQDKIVLQGMVDQIDAKYQAAENARKQLSQDRSGMQDTIAKRDAEINKAREDAQAEQQQMAAQLRETQDKLKQTEENHAALQTRLEEDQKDLMQSASSVLELEEQVKELRAELTQAEARSETHAKELAAQMAQKESEISSSKEALKTARNILFRTQNALSGKDTELEAQKDALTAAENTLSQTQSALRQRTHETEQTAAELRLLKTSRDKDVDALQTKVTQLEDNLAQRQKDLSDLRVQEQHNTEQRFSEVAALTKQLMEREGALNAEVAALRKELHANTTKLQEEQAVATSLATENTVLLQQSEKGHGLAGRMSDTLHAVIEGNALGRNIVRPLADRRKARLLQALGLFDSKWYVEFYSDVREQGVDPALHFIRCGYAEGRAATSEMAGLQNGKTPESPPEK